MKAEGCLKKSIYWQKHPTNNKYFYAYTDSELILLRLNNFPDESLLTLIYKLDIIDIEDAPEYWTIPY